MRILLTGAFNYSQEQLSIINDLGFEIYFLQQERDSLPIASSSIDAVVCNGLFLYHQLDEFTSLKYIQLTSAGFDRVPLNTIKERGIIINNAHGVYSIPMAEWALGRIIEQYKHFRTFNLAQQQKKWNKDRSVKEINGTKSAIIGAGNIGQEVAKRLSAFGSVVTGYDVILGERPYFEKINHIDNLINGINEYDIIVLTAPYTPETHHIISKEMLVSLREEAILVNIARGGLIDTKALVNVLQTRTDLFAALDVFEEEPLAADSLLWALPNAVVSPHNSFVSNGNNERMFSVIYNNLKQYLEK